MFQPQIADFEWNYALDRESGIYAVALRPDVPHLFPPESDEEPAPAEERAEGGDDGEDAEDTDGPIGIAFDGLQDRVMRVPVDEDNYQGLAAVDGFLLYAKTSAFFYGRSAPSPPELRGFRPERTEGGDPRHRDLRLRGERRREDGRGPRRQRVQPLQHRDRNRVIEEVGLHRRPRGGPGPEGRVGADLRRGVAAVPRLLLRREPARARLGRPARPLPLAAALRRTPVRPETTSSTR